MKNTKAKDVFEKGFNCAQSVLFAHGKEYFKNESETLKLASAFGAGISYRGEICGAVSGAFMAIGLRYGFSDPDDELSREVTHMVIKEFSKKFEAINGSLICNTLLDTDISTEEGLEAAREQELFEKICPNMVESSSEILEDLFQRFPVK